MIPSIECLVTDQVNGGIHTPRCCIAANEDVGNAADAYLSVSANCLRFSEFQGQNRWSSSLFAVTSTTKPSDKPEDLTLLDRAWKRAVARFSQDNNAAAKRAASVGGARPHRSLTRSYPSDQLPLAAVWKKVMALGPSQVASDPPHSIPARNITVARTS